MIIVGICWFLDCYEPGEFKPGLQFRSVIAKDRILAVIDFGGYELAVLTRQLFGWSSQISILLFCLLFVFL
jgi:hypothetical protein